MRKVKSLIKVIVGKNGTEFLKKIRSQMWYINSKLKKSYQKCDVDFELVDNVKVYEKDNEHVFFGYYDLPQISEDYQKMLVMTVPLSACEGKDKANIEVVDLNTGEFSNITSTSAWCWQQGARLRWHPKDENKILFNNSDGTRYFCEVWDVLSKTKVDEIPEALYDLDASFKYGITLDFSRLQTFRPGYGYCNVKDVSENEKIPSNTGVFRIDLESKEKVLLVSLEELVKSVPDSQNKYHYINHLSFSKTGKKIMFFHVYTNGIGLDWKLRLYTVNIDGTDLKYVETKETFSHYSWKNDKELLLAAMGDGDTYVYYMYNTETEVCEAICSEHLKRDGHPSWVEGKDTFITDISDLTKVKNCMQDLYIINQDGSNYHKLMNIYSCPLMTGDRRCDLHPRVTKNGRIISMDSTCYKKKRSAIVISLKENILVDE